MSGCCCLGVFLDGIDYVFVFVFVIVGFVKGEYDEVFVDKGEGEEKGVGFDVVIGKCCDGGMCNIGIIFRC